MTTKRQSGWQKLFLILTVLPCCRSVRVSAIQNEYEVANGGDVTLACSFVPAGPIDKGLFISWEAYPDSPDGEMKTVGTYFFNGQPDISSAYEGRASMEVNINSQQTTLTFTKVTIQDSRRYECTVRIEGDEEGTPAATTSLLVLVPPSPPICDIQGTPEYGHNISLTCMSEEASPAPVYKWMTYSINNIQRPLPPKTTEKDGLLSLFNVSRETSGFFICTSTNRLASTSCNVTLSVMPGSMNIGSTIAIIAGVFAAVVVLGIIVYCCCKKGKKDKNVEGSPEEEYNDGDVPETGGQYRDDENEKSNEKKRLEETQNVPLKAYSETTGHYDDDQYSDKSAKDRHEGKGSDIDSRRYQDDQRDQYRGSRDRLDEKRNHYSGSRDRLDDQRDRYGGSRDRLDDQRDRYGGSRDRLDDQRDRYGSRDRLDDQRDRYGGSRDRLDDRRDRYGGSRDRLDDQRERYDDSYDRRDRYGGSRDRLDDRRDRHGGSRDRLDDNSYRSSDRQGGTHDHFAYADD